MAQEKLPPHDIEAEEAVIGSLLIDPEAILKIAISLKPGDFFEESNQLVYQACFSLYQRNEVINQITVAHELMRQGKLEQIGGAGYLSHVISIVPTSLHIEHYAQIVSDMAIMRRLIVTAGQIAAIGYEAGPDVEDNLNRAEDLLFQLRMKQSSWDFVLIRDALSQYFEEAGKPVTLKEGEVAHVLTGFTGLDTLLGGLQRSDLIVLAARPSLGKTSLALNIARNAAINQGACVAIFSLEMSRESVVQRLLSSESGVDSKYIRLGRFNEDDELKIMEASGILSEAAIYVDDSPQVRAIDVRSKARRLQFEHKIDLIIIDYIQLLQGDGRNENRVQELSKITRALKILARELDVPVLAVSQLSRAAELRPSHVPQLSDLRESGTIEQDADIVSFIYRDDIYYTEEDWYKMHDAEKAPYPRGIADIIVAKHRNGPLGRVKLRFLNRAVKFVEEKWEEPETARIFGG